MTLSTEYTKDVIRQELEQTWNEYEPTWVCYANVADRYMREKAKALGKSFNPSVAAIIAGDIAWWVLETCTKKLHRA